MENMRPPNNKVVFRMADSKKTNGKRQPQVNKSIIAVEYLRPILSTSTADKSSPGNSGERVKD